MQATPLSDLHLHIDGSISVAAARKLAELAGMSLDITDEELMRRLSVGPDCRDLNDYLACFDFPAQLLQTQAQIEACVYLLQEELREAGVAYAELRFAPQRSCWEGLTQTEVVEAALSGLRRSSFPAQLILCCMRGDDTYAANLETVRLTAHYLGQGVCALDLAGAEALFPTHDYTELLSAAHAQGIPLTLHAGEADGPQSVWDALSCGAARIGHGVRSVEDPRLLEHLAQTGVTLELCPTSNLNTGVFSRYEEFPLRQLMDAGARVTINSDNMAVSGTDVAHELAIAQEVFSLTDAELTQLERNAIEASFADDELKAHLLCNL